MIDMGEPEISEFSQVLERVGLTLVRELHEGHQSRVFLASTDSGHQVVKFIDAAQADAATPLRVAVNRELSALNSAVVGPIAAAPDVVESAGWFVVRYPFAEGRRPDTDDRRHVATMAVTLADLHKSMALLAPTELPPVAALRVEPDPRFLSSRIIHGDFAPANLIMAMDGLKVIDFGDCGSGSVEFEIGNTLYMERFDSWLNDDTAHYERFRSTFVESYQTAAGVEVDQDLLVEAIRLRTRALGRWLADPSDAPIGISSSSDEWRQRLVQFVGDILG